MTHTVAELEIRGADYARIRKLLKEAGYDHCFLEDGLIDMTGIGIVPGPDPFQRQTVRLSHNRVITTSPTGEADGLYLRISD